VSVVAAPRLRAGPLTWAASTDHKRIGLITAGLALLFFFVSGVAALLMRTELAAPGMQIVSHSGYNQLFTAHGSGMFFLVMVPLALALGVYFVPLQIGAAELAGPRLALAGFWLFLSGAVSIYLGYLTQDGGAAAGWTAFPPLSDSVNSPGTGTDFWILGGILSTAGMALQGWCVLVTLLRLRAPGMTMLRLPVFSWSMLVTCLMVVTSFPVLIVALVLLELDRSGVGVFTSSGGPAAYQHLFWFYGHPVVYVIFFPFVGAVAEVVATFSRRRFFGYHALVLSLLAFAALSMSVWAHHMFTTGQVTNKYFSLTSTALIVPAGIEYFDLLATMIGGAIVLRTAMLFAVGFILQFLLGGLSGIITASPPLDYHVHDSFFVVAHFHYTIFAGSVFAFFAGLYYWFPKATGLLLRESLGKLQFWLMLVGTNLAFFPMFVLGYKGMPRRVADYPDNAGFQTWNDISTAGAFVIALGLAVFLWNLWSSWRRPVPAGDDPWGGQTLEWWTTSPPPRYNFESLPPVRSFAPLLDLRQEEAKRR
jgi:cytochrome c oxidase subunit I